MPSLRRRATQSKTNTGMIKNAKSKRDAKKICRVLEISRPKDFKDVKKSDRRKH
jgi:hypothetical protein